jgi:hypothetical protein
MHDMCEARKSRSSRACRAPSRDPCMRDVWGMPRPADLRACEARDPVGRASGDGRQSCACKLGESFDFRKRISVRLWSVVIDLGLQHAP